MLSKLSSSSPMPVKSQPPPHPDLTYHNKVQIRKVEESFDKKYM